jgi:hypothetical protein
MIWVKKLSMVRKYDLMEVCIYSFIFILILY